MGMNKIANTHNNVANLKALWQLSPPLFRIYRGDLLTQWHEGEERVLNGNREWVWIGLPWCAWIFFRLTRAEMLYLRKMFGKSVTICTLDKGANEWKNFNATLLLPDLNEQAKWDTDEWLDVRVEFRDLAEIT